MSQFLSLEAKDYIKGLIVAMLSAAVQILYTVMSQGGSLFTIDWKNLLNVSIVAGLSYLIKNFFTDHEGKFGGKI